MKKLTTLFLGLVCLLGLVGCNNRSMNYIIENEPSIVGIVEEVRDNSIIIYIENDGYPNGANCDVSLDVENTDSYTAVSVGDEVVVYYNGEIAESDPLQINTVYAITLRNPANRETSKWDCTVTCAEKSNAEKYVITYSDEEIFSRTGALSFQNRNDFDVVIHLLTNGQKERTVEIAAGGTSVLYEVDKEAKYTVGCHAEVDEGIEIKLMVYDGEETEVYSD